MCSSLSVDISFIMLYLMISVSSCLYLDTILFLSIYGYKQLMYIRWHQFIRIYLLILVLLSITQHLCIHVYQLISVSLCLSVDIILFPSISWYQSIQNYHISVSIWFFLFIDARTWVIMSLHSFSSLVSLSNDCLVAISPNPSSAYCSYDNVRLVYR